MEGAIVIGRVQPSCTLLLQLVSQVLPRVVCPLSSQLSVVSSGYSSVNTLVFRSGAGSSLSDNPLRTFS